MGGFLKDLIEDIGDGVKDAAGSVMDLGADVIGSGATVVDKTVGKIPFVGDLLDLDGDGKVTDGFGNLVGSVAGAVGGSVGGPVGSLIGAQVGEAAGDKLQDFLGDLLGGGGEDQSKDQQACPRDPALSCYQKCQKDDREKWTECRALNATWTAEMAKRGCPGTKCRTPSFAKSCRKTTRKKKTVKRKPCAIKRAPKRRYTVRPSCGCS